MDIQIDRIMKDFERITSFTKTPQNGCTRFSYSFEDNQARQYLYSKMHELGLSIKVDAIGNIRAKLGQEINKPSIMIGSHIDTVENGGKYDGLTGVLAALEVIRVIKQEEQPLAHPIELIIFSEEEGSNFGITMLGSKVMTGQYELEELKTIKNVDGVSVYDKVKSFGLDIDNLRNDLLDKHEVEAMIELHIEQGAVLESKNKSIGIVQAIAGMNTYKVTLEGISNHAGTTPMEIRADPMVGAAGIISYMQQAAKLMALPTTVATVGKITCEPNVPNIIPRKVEFFVDIRDVEPKGIEIVSNELESKLKSVSLEHSLTYKLELIGTSETVNLSSRIINTIEKVAIEKEFDYIKMNSGAVHDTAMLNGLTDVGMIFIPSLGGKSHCPDEYTSEKDIEAGCNLMLHVVKSLAVSKNNIQTI